MFGFWAWTLKLSRRRPIPSRCHTRCFQFSSHEVHINQFLCFWWTTQQCCQFCTCQAMKNWCTRLWSPSYVWPSAGEWWNSSLAITHSLVHSDLLTTWQWTPKREEQCRPRSQKATVANTSGKLSRFTRESSPPFWRVQSDLAQCVVHQNTQVPVTLYNNNILFSLSFSWFLDEGHTSGYQCGTLSCNTSSCHCFVFLLVYVQFRVFNLDLISSCMYSQGCCMVASSPTYFEWTCSVFLLIFCNFVHTRMTWVELLAMG